MASKDLFLSYGREPEVSSFVLQLKHDLERHGLGVWLDTEDIPSGSDWHGAIGSGLHDCKALIAVITRRYITSRYCTSELYTADGDQKFIFPVIFEDVDFGGTEKAKGVKYVISGINWTMFRPGVDDYQTSLGKLIQGLREQGLGGGSGSTESTDSEAISSEMANLHLSPSPAHPPYGVPPGYRSSSPLPSAPFPGVPPQTPPQGVDGRGYPSPVNVYYPYPHGYPHQYTTPPHMHAHGYYPPGIRTTPPGVQQAPPIVPAYYYYQPPPPVQGVEGSPVTPPTVSSAPSVSEPLPQYGDLFPNSEVVPQLQGVNQPDGNSSLYEEPSAVEAPLKVAPSRPRFKVGMKLEAVDRRFPYFICVATIMDRFEEEVQIHFDGWGEEYDFRCRHDAVELHPVGWCEDHDWELQTPLNQPWVSWKRYLSEQEATPAENSYFTEGQLAGPGSLLFQINMKLEAKNRQSPSSVCVATIANIKDGQLLIHLDGFSSRFDYWCRPSSSDIHPAMWSGKNGRQVQPPRGHFGHFKWSVYLAVPANNPAPAHIFTEEQRFIGFTVKPQAPEAVGGFTVGMKLEAKDRQYPTLTCVATITKVQDGQLLIHFDDWGTEYDYWCRPDSEDIHPAGWCNNQGKALQAPKGMDWQRFSWQSYLQKTNAVAAPEKLFTEKQKFIGNVSPEKPQAVKPQAPEAVGGFAVGMKLEAKDRQYPTLTCVATIIKVQDGQLLIHFDGWGNGYDYWCRPDSEDIHPAGWCNNQGKPLQVPQGMDRGRFSWQSYLQQSNAVAAPSELFTEAHMGGAAGATQHSSSAGKFKVGMKIEAKDRQYPTLTCVSTIQDIRGGQVLVHFDGWSNSYDYWCPHDSTDIHPKGWCSKHGLDLQPPKGMSKSNFNWNKYLKADKATAAPDKAFTAAQKAKPT